MEIYLDIFIHFILGYYFELYRIKIIQNSQPKFVRGFIIQFIVLSVVSIIFLNHRLVASLIATILIATLVLIDPKVNKLNPLLFLGKISYSFIF